MKCAKSLDGQAQLPGSPPDLQTVEMIGEPGWDRTIDTLIKRMTDKL
jgi:hypothetical protein